jgi:hypothetical protein
MPSFPVTEIQLDPAGIKVKGYRSRRQVVRQDAPKLVERDGAVSVDVEDAEGDDEWRIGTSEQRLERDKVFPRNPPAMFRVGHTNRKIIKQQLSENSGFCHTTGSPSPSCNSTHRKRFAYCRLVILWNCPGAIASTKASESRYLKVAHTHTRHSQQPSFFRVCTSQAQVSQQLT